MLAAPALLIPLAWWTLHQPARWVAAFFAAALLLPPLPIPIGDSGPHPCLLFAALGLFAGLLWLGEWRRAALELKRAALIALFGAAAGERGAGGAAIPGARRRRAAWRASRCSESRCTSSSTLPTGPARHRMRQAILAYLYWIAVASALFACVDFYYQFPAPAGYGPQFVWLDSGVYRRAQGIFYEASTLGNFCAFFLVMIAVAFSRPRAESPGLAQGAGRRAARSSSRRWCSPTRAAR